MDLDGTDWVRLEEEDPLLARQARFNFANYGIDGSGVATNCAPSSCDPHILVNEPAAYIDTQIRELLESWAYKDWLSRQIGPHDPNASDLGEDRFLRCLVIVDQCLSEWFP